MHQCVKIVADMPLLVVDLLSVCFCYLQGSWIVLDSPGILLFRIAGPGKFWKRYGLENPGKSWNYKPAVLEFLVLV